MKKIIALIDDEPDILELLEYNLKKEGYEVKSFTNPLLALHHFTNQLPDLILTDWMMPEMSGLQICKSLKANSYTANVPIFMITCKGDDFDVNTATEAGVTDYLVKPFLIRDLKKRIRELFWGTEKTGDGYTGHAYAEDKELLRFNGITINMDEYTVTADNEIIDLTYNEFKLLALLARNPGRVFTRQEIIKSSSSRLYEVTDRSVDVKVACLRKKLGPQKHLIKTIRSLGYKFVDPS